MNTPGQKTAARIRRQSPLRPKLAVILGSGFGAFLNRLEMETTIPFRRLAGFPQPRVPGHEGNLVLGYLDGVPLLVLSGRAHFYEGHTMAEVTFPIRVLAEFGVQALLLTNAAGGINPRFRPGEFMLLTDHINFMGVNPLRGEQTSGANCFVDLTQVYDRGLNQLLKKAARQTRVRIRSGVYVAVSGPTYETPAEIRAFAKLGADAVGMSTVPEAIVARQCGLRVAALSCITNLAAGRSPRPLSHDDVLEVGARVQSHAAALLRNFVRLVHRNA